MSLQKPHHHFSRWSINQSIFIRFCLMFLISGSLSRWSQLINPSKQFSIIILAMLINKSFQCCRVSWFVCACWISMRVEPSNLIYEQFSYYIYDTSNQVMGNFTSDWKWWFEKELKNRLDKILVNMMCRLMFMAQFSSEVDFFETRLRRHPKSIQIEIFNKSSTPSIANGAWSLRTHGNFTEWKLQNFFLLCDGAEIDLTKETSAAAEKFSK